MVSRLYVPTIRRNYYQRRGMEIPTESVRNLLSLDLRTRFAIKAVEWTDNDRTCCHEPSCSTYVPHISITDRRAPCLTCHRQTCAECRPYHAQPPCPMNAPLSGRTADVLNGTRSAWWNEQQRSQNVRIEPMLAALQTKIVSRHEYNHRTWQRRHGGGRCDACEHTCQRCHLEVCTRCRFTRILTRARAAILQELAVSRMPMNRKEPYRFRNWHRSTWELRR